MTHPTTAEEAKSVRYGTWAGHPKGNAFNPSLCAASVWSGGRGSTEHQCNSKPGHGPDGLYCKTHANKHFPTNEAETWFYTSFHGWKIEERKVSHFTDSFVWLVSGERARKTSRSDRFGTYWPTMELAARHLIDRAHRQISNSKRVIEEAESVLLRLGCTPTSIP